MLTKDQEPRTIIGYSSFFPDSPVKPDVVGASLEYCIRVAEILSQQYCILTCDQAIYDIALGLQSKKPQKYQKLILRMGGFHIAKNFLGKIAAFFILRVSRQC